MDLATWIPFFLATVAISLSPGPGAIAAMGAGLNHGAARGQRIAYGLALGVWTQLLVVGVGLGALLAASGTAFAIVKWVGVAYLVWLGVQQWRAPARISRRSTSCRIRTTCMCWHAPSDRALMRS